VSSLAATSVAPGLSASAPSPEHAVAEGNQNKDDSDAG
jgi:hypothetical protein